MVCILLSIRQHKSLFPIKFGMEHKLKMKERVIRDKCTLVAKFLIICILECVMLK